MDSISDDNPPCGGVGESTPNMSGGMLKHFEILTCTTTTRKGMDGANNDAVHFYDKGDYYVALGNGARRIANDIFHSSNVLKYASVDNSNVPMVSVSRKLFASVICRLLITESAHVQVWCLQEGSSRHWISKKRGSPGNIGDFSEEIQKESITENDSCCLACIYMKRGKVGLVIINTILDLFGVCEYECNPDDIAGILKQYGVKEALICELQLATFDANLKAANITVTKRPSRDFFRYRDVDSVLCDCSKIFGVERSEIDAGILETLNVNVKNPAVLAFCCSMQFIEDNERTNIFQVHRISPLDHIYLNNGAIEALGLAELNKLLNTCQTPMGSRRLKRMIFQPSTDLEEINRRQAIVSSLVDDIELRILVREQILKNCPSAEKTTMRLTQKYMQLKSECLDLDDYNASDVKTCRQTLSDLVSIYKLTQIASKLVVACENSSSLSLWVNQVRAHMRGCAAAVNNLPNVVELESLQKVNGSYFCLVSPRASSKLSHIHTKLQNISNRIIQEAKNVSLLNNVDNLVIKSHDSSATSEGKGEQDKKKRKGKPKLTMYLERNSVHGTFFRVTKKDHSSIFYSNQKKKRKFDNGKSKKNRKSEVGFRIITSQKDGTKFASTELDKLNTEYTNTLQDYEQYQVKIVHKCLSEFGPYCQCILKIVDLIGRLDVYAALADTAAKRNYCRPEFNTSNEIVIENGRHPVVETLDGINFVPNDCKLRSEKQNSPGNCNMVFGPNMGGKSTYVKTNALIILLAQMGSFVPAERASLPVCDSILARVGANDNAGIGASTFMVEMCDMATILRRATTNTFVIVDEIGRGTSTYDGYGLAYALIRHLADNVKAYALVATHFFELKSLGERESVKTVNNCHVTATINKASGNVIMLYKVRKGATNKSYGIACAKMAGFPQAVVDEANRFCAS